MAYDPNKKTGFSVEGFRSMRLNDDRTMPSPINFVGGAGPFDITTLLGGSSGDLTVKIDNAAEETNSVDFSGAVDVGAVTAAEAVTALTAAAFTNVTWSVDANGRVKGVLAVPGSAVYVQVYDVSAAALGFGQGIGLKFIRAFDNALSIGLPVNLKDFEEIETEAGDGTLITVIIDAIIKGLNPVITATDKDYELEVTIIGGSYDDTTFIYEPPNTDDVESPLFFVEIFEPKYSKGTNKKGDRTGYHKLLLRNCAATYGDINMEAKALASYVYNLRATELITDGVKASAWSDQELTNAEFTALNVETV